MINVICLKWGSKYGAEYVNRLYAGVRRNSHQRFSFWCFTDDVTDIRPEVRTMPLKYGKELDSWWNKVYLFSDELPINKGETIFYIDLDTLITGNIDDMLTQHKGSDPVVLRDFYHGIAKTAGDVGSGLMRWNHGDLTHVWEKFIADPTAAIAAAHPHGDQRWVELTIAKRHYWQDLFPNQVVSFKIHCRKGLPKDARIVCYHGKPSIPDSAIKPTKDWKFHIPLQPWVLKYWTDN